MPATWRAARKFVYLDGECVGMVDSEQLARALVEGLELLDELADASARDGWRARLIAWRLRVRALRIGYLQTAKRA